MGVKEGGADGEGGAWSECGSSGLGGGGGSGCASWGGGGGMKGGIVFDECSKGGEEGLWARGA